MKKVFRAIAFFLLAIFLIFLSLGLIFPTVQYQSEVIIEKPLDIVFAAYNDMGLIQEWIPELETVKPIKETNEKVGSKYLMVVNNDGQKSEMTETTLVYEENKLVSLHFDAGMMQKTDTYSFESVNGHTLIKGDHEVKGDSYYSKCVFALFKGAFSQIDQQYLNNFKDWAESNI